MEYSNVEHCGLNGKTPNEFLPDYQPANPPNVCTQNSRKAVGLDNRLAIGKALHAHPHPIHRETGDR